MARASTASTALPVHGEGLVGTPWWGMLCLIATEGILFVYLIFSYGYLASQARGPFVPGGPPALDLALPATILLLASSGTAEWSKRTARGGNLASVAAGPWIDAIAWHRFCRPERNRMEQEALRAPGFGLQLDLLPADRDPSRPRHRGSCRHPGAPVLVTGRTRPRRT